MIAIAAIPAVVALWLLVWSCVRMVQEFRARRRLSLKYCLALGLGLTILNGLFCVALAVMAALGHSEAAKSHAEAVCLVTFLVLVVAPTAGLLVFRHLQPAERASTAVEVRDRQDRGHAIAAATADRAVINRLKRLGTAGLVCGFIIALILAVRSGSGPLFSYAARQGNTSIAMLLADAGVNVDRVDHGGMTAMMHAAANGNAEMARVLLDKGAGVDFCRGEASPLFHAIRGGRIEVVDLLLKWGAQVDFVERYGDTPLIFAGQHGSPQVVETLLNHGAHINARDSIGRTALMRAVLDNRLEVVQVLLKRGSDLTIRDRSGKTALGLRWYGDGPQPDDRIVRLLIEYGATR
jgi:hypothetical protein